MLHWAYPPPTSAKALISLVSAMFYHCVCVQIDAYVIVFKRKVFFLHNFEFLGFIVGDIY